MTFFGIFRGESSLGIIPILFTLLSLRYVWSGIQLGRVIISDWINFVAAPLTTRKKQMSEQAAFFIMVPIAVALHEFGHALATWFFDGRIVDFGYAFFWGYVQPVGDFSFRQHWFISLAGTLANLIFGLAVWAVARKHSSTTIRYLGLRTLRYQIYFALIFYPAFTALSSIGDWRTIYNFALTPVESGYTAVLHLFILGLSYFLDRRGWFDVPALAGQAAETYAAIEKGEIDILNAPDQALATIEALIANNSANRAHKLLRQFQETHPHDAHGYLLQGRLQMTSQQAVSRTAKDSMEKALALGLNRPVDAAAAHEILARYYSERDPQQAIQHANLGIQELDPHSPEHLRQLYILFYRRHSLNRQRRHYDEAFADLYRFRLSGERLNIDGTQAQYDKELDVLQHHSGCTFSEPL